MLTSYEIDTGVDSIFELLTNPGFRVDRCLALGELEAECTLEESNETILIRLTRTVQRNMPAFLARLFRTGQSEHIVHVDITETWTHDGNGGWQGEALIQFSELPISILQCLELYPTDKGSCYTIEQKATVKIPLVGRKVEKYILGVSEDGVEKEVDYLLTRLG